GVRDGACSGTKRSAARREHHGRGMELMQGAIRTGLAITLLTVLCGCQCSKFYNRYPDLIDDVSDCPPRADKWYDPCFDLSRIGKPDWCSCGFNRLWCRCGCARPMEPGFPVPADFATGHPEALGVASG